MKTHPTRYGPVILSFSLLLSCGALDLPGSIEDDPETNAAAIDISRVGAVAEALMSFSTAVLADGSLIEPLKTAISQARGLNKAWPMYYIDMKDLALQLEASSNTAVRSHGTAIVNAINTAVAAALGQTFPNGGSATDFGGFNFMADYTNPRWLIAYAKGTWASTRWGEVLQKLGGF